MANSFDASFRPNNTSSSDGSFNPSDLGDASPNVLSSLAQPSYHFKFYVGADIGTDTGVKYLIAETGFTGFNLTDVEITSSVTPNFQTKNLPGTDFTIKINEPLGMTLPDKIVAACVRAGVQNYFKAPYYLSVDFLGYDEDGSVSRPIQKTWVWKLMLKNIQTDLDVTGGRHTITAIAYNDIGMFDQFNNIKMPIQIDIAEKEGKVGDVMKGLEEQINKGLEKSYGVARGGVVPFVVEIKDVAYKNAGSIGTPFDHKIIRNQKYLDSSRNQEKMQISRGTDIGRIIDYIMSVSETATEMINPDASSTEVQGEKRPYSTMHRVDVTLENTQYNTKAQDYVRKVTFWIRGHETVRPVSSAKGTDEALANGKAKLGFVRSNNYLKKEYQYLFTGLNTEVVDFNVGLNFNFVVARSVQDGYITNENASPGIQYNQENFIKQNMNTGWTSEQDALIPLNACVLPAGSTVPSVTNAGDILGSLNQDIDSIPMPSSYLPITFIQDGNDPRYHVNQAIEASNLRSRSVYAGVLNQLYGTMDSNLGNVDLTIRGDPYWLGVTNTESLETPTTDQSVNYTFGDQVFMLKFYLPQGMDEEGKPILTITDSYSGFYAANKVTHKFNSGTFTQILQGWRIPTMQITQLLGGK